MRFTYYTEKTVSQCMLALNDRLHGGGRLGMEGWVEKNGSFSLGVTSKVARWFDRTTRLQAKVERQGGVTVIKGYVSDGVGPRQQAVVIGALVLAGALLALSGALLPGVIAAAAAFILYIPLAGDYRNSQVLLAEVQRALKAKETLPVIVKKVPTARKPAPAKKPMTAKKPSASATSRASTRS